MSAQQYINQGAPNIIEVTVSDIGLMQVFVQQPNGRIQQYFGANPGSWGSNLYLNGSSGADSYDSGYASNAGGSRFTAVSNVASGSGTSADPWKITTVMSCAATGVTVTQVTSYVDGDRVIGKQFTISNSGGSTFNDLRFYHGGDTRFGNVDSARGWWDSTNHMVYVNNDNFTNQGIMGYYPNSATPESHHFVGALGTGYTLVRDGSHLDDTANSNYVDGSYWLEWQRASLAPGDSWNILSYETWSEPTFLQVIAPASDYVMAGSTVTKTFKVHNLSGSATSVSLALNAAPLGWTANLTGGNSINAAAYEVVDVEVEIEIPVGVNPGDIDNISLTATSGASNGTGSTRLTVLNLDVSIAPNPANFGGIATGSSANRTITFTNNSGNSVTLGNVTTNSTDYSITTDNASNETIANGGTRTIALTLSPTADGDRNGIVNWPITSPIISNLTSNAVRGEAATTPDPDPEPEAIIKEYSYTLHTTTETINRWNLDPDSVLSDAVVHSIAGGLPSNLWVEGDILTGWIASPGTHSFTVVGEEGINRVTSIFTITVLEPTSMPIFLGATYNGSYSPISLVEAPQHTIPGETKELVLYGEIGDEVNLTFTFDYIKGEYDYLIVGGELPEGLSLTRDTGQISGTLTKKGEYAFAISVKDWRGRGFQWVIFVVE